MRRPWRHPRFLALYDRLPHAAFDRAAGWLMRRERPRALVRALVALWTRAANITRADFEPGPFASLEAFFLRGLAPGVRPLGDGLVCPVDGRVTAAGHAPDALVIKGRRLDVATLVGRADPIEVGTALVVFLSPDGYHHVHAPADARVKEVRPIAGRTFPQNDDALAARPDVYLRNARVIVETDRYTLVLVAASLVSQVRLAIAAGDMIAKGDRIGCFTFGSTVALLLPGHVSLGVAEGDRVRMGQRVERRQAT